jgi:hypothetical protein
MKNPHGKSQWKIPLKCHASHYQVSSRETDGDFDLTKSWAPQHEDPTDKERISWIKLQQQ